MLVIDRNNIDTHTLRSAAAALKQFVTSIAPDDRLALVTIPPPGPSVDFTTNHAQVLDAITRIVGSDDPMLSRFNISDYEAIAFENRSNPIVTQRLLYRACGDTDPNTMSPCDRDVEQEALTIATHIRQLTSASVSGYAALLKNLRDVEGPKSMIILSQGLMLDGIAGRGLGAGDAGGRGARQHQRADVRAGAPATRRRRACRKRCRRIAIFARPVSRRWRRDRAARSFAS